jgi:esterase/lipase
MKKSIVSLYFVLLGFSSWAAASTTGVSLLVHGINSKPEKMLRIAADLEAHGQKTILVKLTGHAKASDTELMRNVNRGIWLNDVYQGYLQARKIADQNHVPLTYVGYSLGGLLAVDLLEDTHYSQVHFESMILLAPAVATTFWATVGGYIIRDWPEEVEIPSLGPQEYQVRQMVPVGAYNAMFKSQHIVWDQDASPRLIIPTLVFIDPNDELVSESGLQDWVQQKGLQTQWNFVEMKKTEGATIGLHHLMLDEACLGTEGFSILLGKIHEFLNIKDLSSH